MIISAILTPFVRRIAFKIGAVDKPNARRVNKVPMPTMGGLAIFLAFNFSLFFLLRNQIPNPQFYGIFFGECIIMLTGIIDDIFELKPSQKMIGILLAALAVYWFAGSANDDLDFTVYWGCPFGMVFVTNYPNLDCRDY